MALSLGLTTASIQAQEEPDRTEQSDKPGADQGLAQANRLADMGSELDEVGEYAEAELLHAEALRLRREILGADHADTLTSANDYAIVLEELGRTDEAEVIYTETLRMRREILGERHPDTLSSLDNYAGVLETQFRPSEAEPLYAEALRLRQVVLGERHPDTLTSLDNYAGVLESLDRASEAEPFSAEALRLSRKVLGERHPDTMTSLNNYAGILESLDRASEAEPLYAEVVRLSREVLGERHPDTLTSLHNYAAVLESLDRAGDADPIYAEVLRLSQQVLGARHPETLASLDKYAGVLQSLGRHSEAVPFARQSVLAGRTRIAFLSENGVKDDAQGRRENAELRQSERFLADVLWSSSKDTDQISDSDTLEAFIALQRASARSTSRAVAEAAAARHASKQGLEAIVDERQDLVSEWARTEAALLESLAEEEMHGEERNALRERTVLIEARIQMIDDQLRSEAPEYFTILNQPPMDLAETRGVLHTDEAVLLIVPTERGTHIMALTSEKLEWARAELNDEDVTGAVINLRDGLEVKGADLPYFDLVGAHQLYEALIAPIAETVAGKKRLYVVADGDLSRLPLGVLIATEPPPNADVDDPKVLRSMDWLADRFALVQLPSLQSLAYIRSYGTSGGEDAATSFMGFGDPLLNGTSNLRGAQTGMILTMDATDLVGEPNDEQTRPLMNPAALRTMARLPGTERELEDVRTSLGTRDASLFLGANMTETTIRSTDLSGVSILHLATHGLTSEESGARAEPGLVFTPPSAATSQDDGYLSASEVVGLNLISAEWIIMSACNTASPSGKAGEPGLSGLSRAFFYAGASTLLVSHWPVFDEVAAKLTVGVLTRAENGMPRAEALQAAMKQIRNDESLNASHPAVWAPFTLVGEGM